MIPQPLSVSQLTFAIKNQLEAGFSTVSVQGEISNGKRHSSGHYYFDLKDNQAKISCVMFRGQFSKLATPPKEGDEIIISGALSVYPPHGKYQIIVSSMEQLGIGKLLLQLEALKKKLQAKRWFDPERKKPLPKFPNCIGVITSPTGAVIRDIIHVLDRRAQAFHLILNPVRVQGAEAPSEIAEAINFFNRHQLADVLIVGRGGGSLEDLWAFNEEIVAEAIFRSTIPIVSAVGHETDVTIADFVADVRAPTPSAAAEIVSAEKLHHLDKLAKLKQGLSHTLTHHVKRYRARLDAYARHPLFASPYSLLSMPMQRLDDLKGRLDLLIHRKLERLEERLKGRQKELRALDPKHVLKRGYSVLFAINSGSAIVSTRDLSVGQEVRARLSDGEARLEVKDGG